MRCEPGAGVHSTAQMGGWGGGRQTGRNRETQKWREGREERGRGWAGEGTFHPECVPGGENEPVVIPSGQLLRAPPRPPPVPTGLSHPEHSLHGLSVQSYADKKLWCNMAPKRRSTPSSCESPKAAATCSHVRRKTAAPGNLRHYHRPILPRRIFSFGSLTPDTVPAPSLSPSRGAGSSASTS